MYVLKRSQRSTKRQKAYKYLLTNNQSYFTLILNSLSEIPTGDELVMGDMVGDDEMKW